MHVLDKFPRFFEDALVYSYKITIVVPQPIDAREFWGYPGFFLVQ
jgi:hypothetical protein